MTNHVIDVKGDQATARSYVDAWITSVDDASGINAIGFYDDELVRADPGLANRASHLHSGSPDRVRHLTVRAETVAELRDSPGAYRHLHGRRCGRPHSRSPHASASPLWVGCRPI